MRIIPPLLRLTLVVLVLVGLATPAAAQTSAATLQGTVADEGGGVLPGVVVKLQSPSTGLTRESVTTGVGMYVFNFLPAGEYVITAELAEEIDHARALPELRLAQRAQKAVLDLLQDVGRGDLHHHRIAHGLSGSHGLVGVFGQRRFGQRHAIGPQNVAGLRVTGRGAALLA